MQYKFLNIFLDKNEIFGQENKSINPILLENNVEQLEKLYEFYSSDADLLCVNGFLGTGKAKIVDYSTAFLSSETVVIKYNCFDSTILDDILLTFFSEFKKLFLQNLISEPKIKTESFSQKINSYFAQIEKPFVVILDSFEAILQENRKEILDFIFHLASFSKVKIILISRVFEREYFEDSKLKIDKISTTALERPLFEKFLKNEKIKFLPAQLDEFYKNSRGYYFFTELAIKIINARRLLPGDFLKEFRASFLTFNEFLQKQAISIIPPTSRNLFWFLSIIRHPVSVDLLKALHFWDESKMEFLVKNLIVSREGSLIYVQDYFKETVDLSLAPNIAQKIHQYAVDLYHTQLPLKPLERNILLSRQTMRKEIEYHTIFLPKKPKNLEAKDTDINYLAYSKVHDFELSLTKHEEEAETKEHETRKSDLKPATVNEEIHLPVQPINLPVSQLDNDLPFKLSKEEMSLLDKIEEQQSIERPVADNEVLPEGTPLPEIKTIKSLNEIMEKAKEIEGTYHWAKAVELYKKALTLEDEPDYSAQLPLIYTKIAHAYQKIADYNNAIKYYEMAKNLYEKNKEFVKENYIKLNIAKIFSDTYKLSQAKDILIEITKNSQNPPVLMTKTYIQLANLEDGLSNINGAMEYYRRALEFSSDAMDIETMSELYFKYALILDDKNDVKNAIYFYEKCINLSDDFKMNKFLSSAYSNIATLYMEKDDSTQAVKNYLKAYEIDKQNGNYDGMYYAASKLASILQRKNPEKALEYFETALESAKTLNDIFYIASASLSLGDFYYDKNQDEIALKQYLYALNLVKNDFSKDNIDKIQMRINDIKFRMGVEKFEHYSESLREENK